MSRTSKLPRYNEYNQFDFCFGGRQKHSKKLSEIIVSCKGELVAELGCGKAEVSNWLAEQYPENFYIGVDKKSDRMWRGAKNAIENKSNNIAFVQTDIRDLGDYLEGSILDSIWITFPDPYPRDRHEKHRMINSKFLDLYKKLLKPGGRIFFKTDDDKLYKYFLEEVLPKRKDITVVEKSTDLHNADLAENYKIKTSYENKWLAEGKKIKFVHLKYK